MIPASMEKNGITGRLSFTITPPIPDDPGLSRELRSVLILYPLLSGCAVIIYNIISNSSTLYIYFYNIQCFVPYKLCIINVIIIHTINKKMFYNTLYSHVFRYLSLDYRLNWITVGSKMSALAQLSIDSRKGSIPKFCTGSFSNRIIGDSLSSLSLPLL